MFILSVMGLWDNKKKKFVEARRKLLPAIRKTIQGETGIIWFHAASLGEFEEARPVMEAIRSTYPEKKILLTFFSPSGYEIRKDWPVADWVFYLPMDTAYNAREFIRIVRPEKAVFTIGEHWFNYLKQLKKHKIDTYIISVRTVASSPYTKWYGCAFRRLLRTSYKAIMVKDDYTLKTLEDIGCTNVIKTGDSRFDRVMSIANSKWNNAIVEKWLSGKSAFIAGSTHKEENEMVVSLANSFPDVKIMVVPHEISEKQISGIIRSVTGDTVIYSGIDDPEADSERLSSAQVLIIDKIGMLGKLYRYGHAALIGGGFTTLPHSTLEAAVYGMPVAMGPMYAKNMQFVELSNLGAATPVYHTEDLLSWYKDLYDNPAKLKKLSKIAHDYCTSKGGVTQKIMNIIFS